MERFHVIIPAAGQSTRFGGGRNKLLQELGGRAILQWTIHAFMDRSDVGGMILATRMPPELWSESDPDIKQRLDKGWLQVCAGGDSRAASVCAALEIVPPDVHWVAVHDAARPLISGELISRVFAAAIQYGASAPRAARYPDCETGRWASPCPGGANPSAAYALGDADAASDEAY